MHHKYPPTHGGCPDSNNKKKKNQKNNWQIFGQKLLYEQIITGSHTMQNLINSLWNLTSRPYLRFFPCVSIKTIILAYLHTCNFHPDSSSLVSLLFFSWDLKIQSFPYFKDYPLTHLLSVSPISLATFTIPPFYIKLNCKTPHSLYFFGSWLLFLFMIECSCFQKILFLTFLKIISCACRGLTLFSSSMLLGLFWAFVTYSGEDLAMLSYLCA